MTSPRAAAIGLLERLRKVAETWTEDVPPGLLNLPRQPGDTLFLSLAPGFEMAVNALEHVNYYDARGRTEALDLLDAAIAALKGETP